VPVEPSPPQPPQKGKKKWIGIIAGGVLLALCFALDAVPIQDADVELTISGNGLALRSTGCGETATREILRGSRPVSEINFNAVSPLERSRLPPIAGAGIQVQGLSVSREGTVDLWVQPRLVQVAVAGTSDRDLTVVLDGQVERDGSMLTYHRKVEHFTLPSERPVVLVPSDSPERLVASRLCLTGFSDDQPAEQGAHWDIYSFRAAFADFPGAEQQLDGVRARWSLRHFDGTLAGLETNDGRVKASLVGRVGGLTRSDGRNLMPTRLDQGLGLLGSKPVRAWKDLTGTFRDWWLGKPKDGK
jgi:hypothetical protein